MVLVLGAYLPILFGVEIFVKYFILLKVFVIY